jgi:hypothetical protein
MFDHKSDYALNKLNPDAIVYKSVTGEYIWLTCADFDSEEEFLQCKAWSDEDYRNTEKSERHFCDKCVSLDACMNYLSWLPSIETELFTALSDKGTAEKQAKEVARKIKLLKSWLTKIQYRRLWMRYGKGLSVEEIAGREGVSAQAVYECLADARRRIVNKL